MGTPSQEHGQNTDNPRLGMLLSATNLLISKARPEGVEPPTRRFEACRSVQLSYGRVSERSGS
jgi:hypothetical protein